MKLSNVLFLLLFSLTNREAFASNDEAAERIGFEEQLSRFQSAFQKLQTGPRHHCFDDSQIIDLSSDLAGICNQAIRLTKEELEEKSGNQNKLTLLGKFDHWVAAKIQSQKLGISDVKTLFSQLAFLRGQDKLQRDFVKTFIEINRSNDERSDWWQDEKHVFFQLFSSSFFPLCCEMFLIPDQDCSMAQAYLRAFIREPKTKIVFFSFGQEQQPFLDLADAFFRQVKRPSIINWFRDSTESLDVLRKVTQELWVEGDPLSTACLYLLIRDFMIDKDDLLFDENLQESKEEQFFSRWIKNCFARIKSHLLGKDTIALDFIEHLKQRMNEGSDRGVSISLAREIRKQGGKLTIPIQISFKNQMSSPGIFPPTYQELNCAILDLVVETEKKSDLMEEYKVTGWDNWRDPRVDDFTESKKVGNHSPVLKVLDDSRKVGFLPFVEKVKDQFYSMPTVLHYFLNIRGDYVPLLTMFFPDSGLTVDCPNNTMDFFQSIVNEFSDLSLEKLKIFRE